MEWIIGSGHSPLTDEEIVHEESATSSSVSCQPSEIDVARSGRSRRRRRSRGSRSERHLSEVDGDSTDDELMFLDEALRRLSGVSLEDVQCCRFSCQQSLSKPADNNVDDWVEEILEDEEDVMWDLGTALRRLSVDVSKSLVPSMAFSAGDQASSSVIPCRSESLARPSNPDHAPLTLLKQTLSVCRDSERLRRSSRVDVKSFSLEYNDGDETVTSQSMLPHGQGASVDDPARDRSDD